MFSSCLTPFDATFLSRQRGATRLPSADRAPRERRSTPPQAIDRRGVGRNLRDALGSTLHQQTPGAHRRYVSEVSWFSMKSATSEREMRTVQRKLPTAR